MSIDTRTRGETLRSVSPTARRHWFLAAVLGALIGTPGLWAQRTTFDPAVTLNAYQEYVGLTEADEGTESVVRVGLELPVVRQFKKGTFSFTYFPRYEKFESTEALDNTGHQLTLALESQPTRLADLRLTTTYSKTLEQADARSLDDADLFLTQRSERELAGIRLTYSNRLTGRWFWGGRAGYSSAEFSKIADFQPPGTQTPVEDRTTTFGALRLSRRVSARTSVGLEYESAQFDLDQSGTERSELVSLTLDRELSRNSTLELTVGGFRSSGDAARGGRSDLEDSREGAQGELTYTHAYKRLEFSAFASVRPTGGGARVGTSTNAFVGFSLADRKGRRVEWDFAVRYGRRDPSDPNEADIDNLSLRLGAEFKVARPFSLRLAANYVDQTGEAEDLRLLSEGGLSLVWYPLAGNRISGRRAGDQGP